MSLRLRLLETRIDLEAEDAGVAALLERMWGPFATASAGAPDKTFRVRRDGDGWFVSEPGFDIRHPDVWGLLDALRYRMTELVESRLTRYVTLHAAAIACRGRLVLLAGESGAGKTTLTLGLLRAGWTYLSDDVAPIDLASGEVAPFPKPLGVKDPALWDPRFADAPVPERAFLVPATVFEVAAAPLLPEVLVFPRYVAGADTAVEEMTPAKATALSTPYVRRLEPEVVGALKRLCSGCRSYRLTYGDTRAGVNAVGGLLDRIT